MQWRLILSALLLALASHASSDTIKTGDGRVIENPTQDGDLTLRVNDGGVRTNALVVTGSTSVVSLANPLPVGSGGTNKNMTPVNGGLIYSDADSQEVTSAGALQDWVLSGGAAAPTMSSTTTTGKVIDGTVDEIQLRVQAHSSQTGNPTFFVVENSGGTDLLSVNTTTGAAVAASATGTGVTVAGSTQPRLQINSTGNAEQAFFEAAPGEINFGSLSSTPLKFYVGSSIKQTVGTDGIFVSTAGVKVKNTGAGSDTLSWYEEGSFSPALSSTGTAPTPVYAFTPLGRYTRIGRLVYFQIDIAFTDISNVPTGNSIVTGLPYTSNSTTGLYAPITVWTNHINIAGKSVVGAQIAPNTAQIELTQLLDSTASTNLPISQLDTAQTQELNFSGFYIAQ